MTFIKKNMGIIIFYAVVLSLAFLFENPTEKAEPKINPSQNLVVMNSN